MTKKFLATMLALLKISTAYSLPLGNPTEASIYTQGLLCSDNFCCSNFAISGRLGFYGDYVFNRHLRSLHHSSFVTANIKQTEMYTNAGYLALNFCDRIDLFSTVGATSLTLHGNNGMFTDATAGFETVLVHHFSTNFSWSVGSRATLWRCGCFGLGIEGQYFVTYPHLNFSDEGGDLIETDGSTKYREWQVGLGISYTVSLGCAALALIPYTGITWANAKLDEFTFTPTLAAASESVSTLKNQKRASYVIGTTFTICGAAGISVEGRFAAEKAVYVNGQFRF